MKEVFLSGSTVCLNSKQTDNWQTFKQKCSLRHLPYLNSEFLTFLDCAAFRHHGPDSLSCSAPQTVIDANIFPVLIEILQKAEFRTRKEAAWAITNATSGGTPEQIRSDWKQNWGFISQFLRELISGKNIWDEESERCVVNVCIKNQIWKYVVCWCMCLRAYRYLVNLGCIKPLCDLLTVMDSKIVQVALNGLENILRLGEQEAKQENNGTGVNPYCSLIEEAYGTRHDAHTHAYCIFQGCNVCLRADGNSVQLCDSSISLRCVTIHVLAYGTEAIYCDFPLWLVHTATR